MRRVTPWALSAVGAAALLLLGTAALGPSAASPALRSGTGWRASLPPYSFDAGAPSWLVTVLLDAGYVLGAVGVALGLWAAYRGERLPRGVVQIACAAAVLAAFLPPLGSADHLSYAAYGRIAAQGGDPYSTPPASWDGGHDAVTSAVEPPWTTTPSVYGPVATGVQAATSWVGADSVRATVWAWQLVCLASWLLIGLLLLRLSRSGIERERATWVWLLNPLLLGLLMVGAHVDVLGAALGLAALALAARRPFLAGLLLGAAVGVKIPFAVLGPAVLYALWRNDRRAAWRPALWGVLGAFVVLVPAQIWAGTHLLDQLERARRYVSLATPWRPIVEALTGPYDSDTVRSWVVILTPAVVLLVAALLWVMVRRSRWWVERDQPPMWREQRVPRDAAAVAVVLGAAYVLGAPYSLPWYDAIAWAPLGLVGVPALDAVLLARLLAYAVAYVPGRVLGSSARVEDVTLGLRREVTPWIGAALLLAVLLLATRRPRARAG